MKPTLLAALLLAGCTASQNAAVDRAIATGQLYCQRQAALGAPVVQLANDFGAGVSVIGQTSKAVADACLLVNAIPVPPPADPGAVPVVKAPTTLPMVKS